MNFDSEPQRFPAVNGAEISPRAHEVQKRADSLFNLYGHSCDAPRPGETDVGFMRRVLESAKRYSPAFALVDFTGPKQQPAEALPSIFTSIVDEAVTEFQRPTGSLRKVTTTNPDNGRTMSKFYGDPSEAWRPFKALVRYAKFDTSMFTGINAVGAIKPVEVLMSDGSTRPA